VMGDSETWRRENGHLQGSVRRDCVNVKARGWETIARVLEATAFAALPNSWGTVRSAKGECRPPP
jgi:hypothetical protein